MTEFYKQFSNLQKTLKAPKSQYNNFGKYSYRNCEDILEALKQVLPEGWYVNISDQPYQLGERVYIEAVATISDGNSRVAAIAYAREQEEKKGMDASQITGSASSYARKYALGGLLALDDTKDADSNEAAQQKAGSAHGFKSAKEAKELWKSIKDGIDASGNLSMLYALRDQRAEDRQRLQAYYEQKGQPEAYKQLADAFTSKEKELKNAT